MTPDQTQIVHETWKQVVPIADAAGELFYRRLFEIDPSTCELFRATDMPAQRRKLLQMLAVAVRGLDNLDALASTVEELGRRHAGYGVTDSQYNLAILYARGIGIPANLAESYRWFALAAANGDTDAAKKRDEVAVRLDQQALAAAQLAVQGFVVEREPDEATSLRTPPGGWDRTPATPVEPRRQIPMSQVPVTQAPALIVR